MANRDQAIISDFVIEFLDEDNNKIWFDAFDKDLESLIVLRDRIEHYNLSPARQAIFEEEKRYIQELQEWLELDPNNRLNAANIVTLVISKNKLNNLLREIQVQIDRYIRRADELIVKLTDPQADMIELHRDWVTLEEEVLNEFKQNKLRDNVEKILGQVASRFRELLGSDVSARVAAKLAQDARRPLDHKKFLDMLIDETEEKFIELVVGTRSQTAVIDDYVKRIITALDDDFDTQFYEPAFRQVRETNYSCWAVDFAQIEHTSVLANNRGFGKVLPQATMEFDLPKRQIVLTEAMQAAQAAYTDYGALIADPNFLALTKLYSGQPAAPIFNDGGPTPLVRDVLPGMSSQTDEGLMIQGRTAQPQFASQLEALIPDPAVYKFETGTGFEIRPVIQPDGQSVVFKFDFMDTTNIREPIRADEKHLGRVKRHFINTDVQLSNFELRKVSQYRVALKAARTSRGVPLLEDIPALGMLFRPLPQAESSLQQNVILSQATIFPTLFDLMGLRWAPAVADVDVHSLREQEFVFGNRMKLLKNEVYDYSSTQVDEFLRIQPGERRPDLYRTQEQIPHLHPNGYNGPGLNRQDSQLQEGYYPSRTTPHYQEYESSREKQLEQKVIDDHFNEQATPLFPVEPETSNKQSSSRPVLDLPPLPTQQTILPNRETSYVDHDAGHIRLVSDLNHESMGRPALNHHSQMRPQTKKSNPNLGVTQLNSFSRETDTAPAKSEEIHFLDQKEEKKQRRWRFPNPFSKGD